MKLPAKIDYACKAIMELSLHYQDGATMQLKAIAKAQAIPKQFLVQLMIRMKNAGLVDSKRGVAGGYFLTKAPSYISLADIFKAIDDNIIAQVRTRKFALDSERLIGNIWDEVNDEINMRLKKETLDNLIARLKKTPSTYCI